jgi:ABC-type lipoprotein release transport system permease subunit
LGRSRRRTLLSLLGVGLGCAIAVFSLAFMRGGRELRVRAISESGFGHARVVPKGWEQSRRNELRLDNWQSAQAQVRAMEGVKLAAAHARVQGLLAFGTRVAGVELLGVDALVEPQLNRLVRALKQGRYLQRGDAGKVVVGQALVERLDVELGDDLLLTLSGADGELEYAMLHIVGIVATGSREIDLTICHLPLADVEQLTGRPGAGEITVVFERASVADELTARLAEHIKAGNEVLSWRQVLPAMGGDAAGDKAFTNLFIGIVIAVVILGVASAQLTAMLERRREFAVLMALGMKGEQILRLVLIEAGGLGIIGGLVGLVLALPLVYHTATQGIDFSDMMKGNVAVEGVFFDPVIYADMGFWMLPYALFIGLLSTLVAALYPAWSVLRSDPGSALSMREV